MVRERTQIRNYQFVQRIGEGGMAEVWLVHRQGPGGFRKRLALKRVLPALAEDTDLERMFIEEARIAASLDHPNVIQAVDFGDSDSGLYLAMEYVDGTSVRQLYRHFSRANVQFPLGAGLLLGRQAAAALDYVHHATDEIGRPMDLVHRDLTPTNLLVDKNANLKLTDFGIALQGATTANKDVYLCTPGSRPYMSPEQVLGLPLSAKSDVYALAVVLTELLSGTRLFKNIVDPKAALQARHALPTQLPALLSARPCALISLLRSALDCRAERRPTAAQLGAGIAKIIASLPHGASAAGQLSDLVREVNQPQAPTQAVDGGEADATRTNPWADLRAAVVHGLSRIRGSVPRVGGAVRRHRSLWVSALAGATTAAAMYVALHRLAPATPQAHAVVDTVVVPYAVQILTETTQQATVATDSDAPARTPPP